MANISMLDLQNLRHLIGGFDTTHCKMQAYADQVQDKAERKKRIYNFWSIINCMEKGVNRTVIYSLILMLSFAQKRKRESFPEKGKGL